MKVTAHTIDVEDDGSIKLTFTIDNRQNFSFIFTPEQIELLAGDLLQVENEL